MSGTQRHRAPDAFSVQYGGFVGALRAGYARFLHGRGLISGQQIMRAYAFETFVNRFKSHLR
jgi:hypothetical protein